MHQDPTLPQRKTGRKLPPRRGFLARSWFVLVLLAALAIGGGAYYYYDYATVASAEVAIVQRGTALASVYGTVNVSPVEQVIVKTRNFGQLTDLKVYNGTVVKTGQIVAEMTDDTLQRQLSLAESNLAQSKIRQSLGPPSASALKNQEIEVDKLQKLVAATNIAPVELEKAQNELTSLREQVQNETINLNTEVDNLERARDDLLDQLKQMQLTAPMDGVVLNLYVNLGEFLPPQSQVCRIGSAENRIVANVNEEDVGYLKVGMKAHIRLYSFPDKDLIGTLSYILPQGENQVYPVYFSLDDPSETLRPGMTGEMNVIVGERENALTIPTRAIRRDNIVLVVVNGKVQETHVQVGFHTIEKSEILDGLNEGSAVILSNQDLYRPGMRVRELITRTN
jgi:RND family efflux transporter MFP subunit